MRHARYEQRQSRSIEGRGLGLGDWREYATAERAAISLLRHDTLWQGDGNRGMRTFLNEPASAKRAAIFMAKTGLLGKLGKACLTDVDAAAASSYRG